MVKIPQSLENILQYNLSLTKAKFIGNSLIAIAEGFISAIEPSSLFLNQEFGLLLAYNIITPNDKKSVKDYFVNILLFTSYGVILEYATKNVIQYLNN